MHLRLNGIEVVCGVRACEECRAASINHKWLTSAYMCDYSVDDDDNNAEQGLYDKYVKRKFIHEQSEHRVCTDEGKKRFRDIDIGI